MAKHPYSRDDMGALGELYKSANHLLNNPDDFTPGQLKPTQGFSIQLFQGEDSRFDIDLPQLQADQLRPGEWLFLNVARAYWFLSENSPTPSEQRYLADQIAWILNAANSDSVFGSPHSHFTATSMLHGAFRRNFPEVDLTGAHYLSLISVISHVNPKGILPLAALYTLFNVHLNPDDDHSQTALILKKLPAWTETTSRHALANHELAAFFTRYLALGAPTLNQLPLNQTQFLPNPLQEGDFSTSDEFFTQTQDEALIQARADLITFIKQLNTKITHHDTTTLTLREFDQRAEALDEQISSLVFEPHLKQGINPWALVTSTWETLKSELLSLLSLESNPGDVMLHALNSPSIVDNSEGPHTIDTDDFSQDEILAIAWLRFYLLAQDALGFVDLES